LPPARTSPAPRRCRRCRRCRRRSRARWSVRAWWVVVMKRSAGGGAGVESGRDVVWTPSFHEKSTDGAHAGGTIPVDVRVGRKRVDGARVVRGALASTRTGRDLAAPDPTATSWGYLRGGRGSTRCCTR
jgi:hypothetical protein